MINKKIVLSPKIIIYFVKYFYYIYLKRLDHVIYYKTVFISICAITP
jgi:hypothetical protein